MWFWVILVLLVIFLYFYAGLCVYLAAKPSGKRTDPGERLVMFGLSMFFWPLVPIVALVVED